MNQPAKILLIEDDAGLRAALGEILRDAGYEVLEAGEGNSGIRIYTESTPDLVITDVIMPEKEGIETILALKKINPKVCIIAMSGGGKQNAETYLQVARFLGARRILTKPFSMNELLTAVQGSLAGT